MRKIFSAVLFGFILIFGSVFASSSRDLEGVTIVSRSEWGADEGARLHPLSKAERAAKAARDEQKTLESLKKNNPKAYEQRLLKKQQEEEQQKKEAEKTSERSAYYRSYYPYDRFPDRVVEKSGSAWLIREDMFTDKKDKIIVHHTAMPYDPSRTRQDIQQKLQDIYSGHIKRFGDVAYHFLIDPQGTIYEGKAGGPSVVGTHVAFNNMRSIGISLMGNFEEQEVTPSQYQSLIKLLTAVAKKYGIDPYKKVTYQRQISQAPYLQAHKNYSIIGHKDTAATACPGADLYKDMETIRTQVALNLKAGTASDQKDINSDATLQQIVLNPQSAIRKLLPAFERDLPQLDRFLNKKKLAYGKVTTASITQKKIQDQLSVADIQKALEGEISVLLYELSSQLDSYHILCPDTCELLRGGEKSIVKSLMVKKAGTTFSVEQDGASPQKLTAFQLQSLGAPMSIENYARASYNKVPWNNFKGSLLFEKGIFPDKTGNQKEKLIVINRLPFLDYLQGIVETNDQESMTKNQIMALLAKNYALFYTAGKNRHPSIDAQANYQAIDDADFFQKYVGAGVEKTLTKRKKALETTKNQIVLYQEKLPILPYFNCSPGFTLSAKEKRGWTDTPYLKSMIDFSSCQDFNGHGVGLAGQGAELLAQFGWTYDEIIEYYYPGVHLYRLP